MQTDKHNKADKWIKFLRMYGPVSNNENMYDEHINKASLRLKIDPLKFEHPIESEVIQSIIGPSPISVILTGTAGDGKTHLTRQVWQSLNAPMELWASDNPYLAIDISPMFTGVYHRRLHIIRDLSAWVPAQGMEWPIPKLKLLLDFINSLNNPSNHQDVYLIAANDGQLVDALSRLPKNIPNVQKIQQLIEDLLVEDGKEKHGIPLKLFNLSRWKSGELFDLALDAILLHPAWHNALFSPAKDNEFFGKACPIRRNLELLSGPLLRKRLRELISLSDYCGIHIPIRQIMLLLSNIILGHPDAKEQLMVSEDVPRFIREDSTYQANIYQNIFGNNLTESRRNSTMVFDALRRFGIGMETSNQIDNLLIFGKEDEFLKDDFEKYLGSDDFYGATKFYLALQQRYIDDIDLDGDKHKKFIQMLVNQRQSLFFKITEGDEKRLHLWNLTVFKFAGEYLENWLIPLQSKEKLRAVLIYRLILGLNRIFTGRLVTDDRELLLATDPRASYGKLSFLLIDRIAVNYRGRNESITIELINEIPTLIVLMDSKNKVFLPLYLTRFEFIMRIAEGMLPHSFSKEHYEDILAFKARLLSVYNQAQGNLERVFHPEDPVLLNILSVDETGRVVDTLLEIHHD